MVCDFQELYRHLMDDFLIQYCQNLKANEFIVKAELVSRTRQGQRVYLNDMKTRSLMNDLNGFFESYVEVPRMRVGTQQTVETLLNEEALSLAKYLRNERKTWTRHNVYVEVRHSIVRY